MFLHIEGVNFGNTIYDTNDLSTIRGASMYLEQLGQEALAWFSQLEAELIDSGGAKAILHFKNPDPTSILARLDEFLSTSPWSHFSLTSGLGQTQPEARNNAQIAAISGWSVPRLNPLEGDFGPDPEDYKRPATKDEISKDGKSIRRLSTFTALRREKGRNHRPVLFSGSRFRSPLSLDKIVQDPSGRELPVAVRNKLAVVRADGIGGGRLAAGYPHACGKDGFATAMDAFRNRLAKAILQWIEDEELFLNEDAEDKLQLTALFDVMLWGGDDMTFVLPAHRVVSFAAFLMDEFEKPFDPSRGTAPFHHRIGVAMAHFKTPFRQLFEIADDLERMVKEGLSDIEGQAESAVCFAAFESAVVPVDGMSRFWKELYGANHSARQEIFTRSELSEFRRLCSSEMTSDEEAAQLSLTQANRALLRARSEGATGAFQALASERADETARKVLNDHYQRRKGQDAPIDRWIHGINGRSFAMLLAQITQLKPYVDCSELDLDTSGAK